MKTQTLFGLVKLVTPISLAATMVMGFSSNASAISLKSASDFNLFVFGNVKQSNTDVEGRMAVGGNATIKSYGVGDKLTNSQGMRDDLIVGGDLNYFSGQVFNGNAVYGGTGKISQQVGLPNGKHYQGSPIDFDSAKQELLDLSKHLGNLTPTGTTGFEYGQISLNGAGAGLNVFHVSGDQLSSASGFSINGDADSTVVVNVTGKKIALGNFGFNLSGVDKQNVLFNFVDTKKLSSTSLTWKGSVLAPKAAYDFNNGNLEGTLIANSLTGNGEFHNYQFKGDLPEDQTSVPEPATLAGLGLVAAAGVVSRRKNK